MFKRFVELVYDSFVLLLNENVKDTNCSEVNKDFTLLYKVLINKTSCYMIKLTNMAD